MRALDIAFDESLPALDLYPAETKAVIVVHNVIRLIKFHVYSSMEAGTTRPDLMDILTHLFLDFNSFRTFSSFSECIN